MGDEEKRILASLQAGEFVLSIHAAHRMDQRSVTYADIRACALSAESCFYQRRRGTWRIEGKDLDGKSLTVICGVDVTIVIVTIF